MRSIADIITADIASRRPRVDVVHPRAGEWRVTYRLPVDFSEFEPQQQALIDATKAGKPFNYQAAVLAILAESISHRGEALAQADGSPATFSSRELIAALDADSASDAVRKLYGSDGIVQAVYARVFDEVGLNSIGEVIVERGDGPDPTNAG